MSAWQIGKLDKGLVFILLFGMLEKKILSHCITESKCMTRQAAPNAAFFWSK
jgi:hypothetical protein